jgi:glutamine cyclotransferase
MTTHAIGRRALLALLPLLIAACAPCPPAGGAGPCAKGCGYEVVNAFPHDPEAFTQGLQYDDGVLYESTGLEGRSSVRRVALETGLIEQQQPLEARYFGEGLAIAGDRIVQLTWTSGKALVYDKSSFALLDTWTYPGEGWGLTTDGQRFIMSDGTSTLVFRSLTDFSELGRIEVRDGLGLVRKLNELEYIDGLVYANVWQTDSIVIIDTASGKVRGRISLRGLLPLADRTASTDVLNGIAYDTAGKRLFVTGKNWPKLFEIRLTDPAAR